MKFSLKHLSFGSTRKRGLYIWIRHYKSLFVVSFLILTGYIAYQWNRDLYQYHWTDEERKAYLETTAKETAFQEKKFLGVIERLDQDRERHESRVETGRDLFAGARKKPQ